MAPPAAAAVVAIAKPPSPLRAATPAAARPPAAASINPVSIQLVVTTLSPCRAGTQMGAGLSLGARCWIVCQPNSRGPSFAQVAGSRAGGLSREAQTRSQTEP